MSSRRRLQYFFGGSAFVSMLVSCSLLLDPEQFVGDVAARDAATDTNDASADSSVLGCDAPGLLAAWSFDEGKGIVAGDCTGHGFEATLFSGATWDAGRDSGAIDFVDGSAYAQIFEADGLRRSGPMSIAARVLYRSFVDNGRIFAISKPRSKGGTPGIELAGESENSLGKKEYVSILTNYSDAPDAAVTLLTTNTNTTATNDWVHVAAVVDDKIVRIYRNGELEGQNAAPAGIARLVSDEPAYIGRRSDCCFMNGRIDDLRIYDRALTQEEVRVLAESQ